MHYCAVNLALNTIYTLQHCTFAHALPRTVFVAHNFTPLNVNEHTHQLRSIENPEDNTSLSREYPRAVEQEWEMTLIARTKDSSPFFFILPGVDKEKIYNLCLKD